MAVRDIRSARVVREDIEVSDRELPLADIGSERLERLYHYWLDRCDGRAMPARRDLRPEGMRDSLGVINLIDVVGPPYRFRFRLIGTEVANAYGEDMTGRFVDEVRPAAYAAVLQSQYAEVVERRAPALHELAFDVAHGHHDFRRLTLPLSGNGRDVDMLITASAFGRDIRPTILEPEPD